jgi:hypothetical protein
MLKFIKHNMETIANIEVFPLISLVIFFSFFVGLLVYVTRLSKEQVETMGALPLDTDPVSSHLTTPFTTQNHQP